MFELRNPVWREVPALRDLWKEAFGDGDAFLDAFFYTAFAPERSLIADVEGEIAAALFWFFCEYAGGRLGYLYGVCTRAAYRGRGFCRKLMAAAEKTLAAQGCAGVILVPGSEALASMYAAMGYVSCCPMAERRIYAGQTPLFVEPVSPETYGALRKNLLPMYGVRQEGVNLAFQARLGRLYQGMHCIFTIEQTGSKAMLKELLTDGANPEALAAGALAALQIDSAILRWAEVNGKMFAMFKPQKPCRVPDYFGLAFD